MQDHIVNLVNDSLLVNTCSAGTPSQHAGTAACRQRCLGIYLVNQAAHPEEMLREPVLIEARPVVPKRPVRVGQRPRVLDGRRRHFAEALISGSPFFVGVDHCAVLLFEPFVKHPLAPLAVANVHQFVRLDVIKQLGISVELRNVGLNVLLYGLQRVWAFEADHYILSFPAPHRIDIPDQVTAPAVPPHTMRIGPPLERRINRRVVDRPPRSSADCIAFDVLKRCCKKALESLAWRMQGEDHHGLVAFVEKKRILHWTAFQWRERANQRVAYLGVVCFWHAINALNFVLQLQASTAATLHDIGKHFALLLVIVKPGQTRTNLKSELGSHQIALLVYGLYTLQLSRPNCFPQPVKFLLGFLSECRNNERLRYLFRTSDLPHGR